MFNLRLDCVQFFLFCFSSAPIKKLKKIMVFVASLDCKPSFQTIRLTSFDEFSQFLTNDQGKNRAVFAVHRTLGLGCLWNEGSY